MGIMDRIKEMMDPEHAKSALGDKGKAAEEEARKAREAAEEKLDQGRDMMEDPDKPW